MRGRRCAVDAARHPPPDPQLAPDNPILYTNRAMAELKAGRLADAEEDASLAIALDPAVRRVRGGPAPPKASSARRLRPPLPPPFAPLLQTFKAYLRRASARREARDFRTALDDLHAALALAREVEAAAAPWVPPTSTAASAEDRAAARALLESALQRLEAQLAGSGGAALVRACLCVGRGGHADCRPGSTLSLTLLACAR